MKIDVTLIETREVESADAAGPVALEFLARGLMVATGPASNREDDFRYIVTAYERLYWARD
jgi:hypothetical protein